MSRFSSGFAILNTTAPPLAEAARRRLSTKLWGFSQLSVGWDYGRGVPVTACAVAAGDEFLFIAARLGLTADVFPNPDGGCSVVFYRDQDSVEVTISSGGFPLGLRAERGIGHEFEDVITPMENAQVKDIVKQVFRLVPEGEWTLRASSAYATSTGQLGVFGLPHFGTHQRIVL